MLYHLKIMLRNLRCGGIYSAINIGGLAIGMAAAILILTWIYHEWSYDRFHAKGKNLYVVYNRSTSGDAIHCWDWTSAPLGPILKTDYPEIVAVARMSNDDELLYENGEIKFKINTGITDPDFLSMFDFPLLQGVKETALDDPYSVILTEKTAKRLFGREDPMGKSLLVNNLHSLTITGVMKDLPENTQFQFEALIPVHFLKIMGRYNENWMNNSLKTFVELQPDARLELVNESIRDITNAHTNGTAGLELFLYALGKRHVYSKFENGVPA